MNGLSSEEATAAVDAADAERGAVTAESEIGIIELRGISKFFPGVIANEDINLSVREGEIHAICGENGAGKSTLMKIIYGMQPPDEGEILVRGREVRLRSPRHAISCGIGMVHQHFMLADNLSVLENVILGAEPTNLGYILKYQAEEQVAKLSEDYGLDVSIHTPVEELAVGQRQKVEIIKALFRGVDILILDEPTSVLVPQEVEDLFVAMNGMKAQGKTLLFIDHKLDEVLEIADRITVLRAGHSVATIDKADATAHDLAELMIGSELPVPETFEDTVAEDVLLKVEGLNLEEEKTGGSEVTAEARGRRVLSNINISVHEGEIVGIAGVEGNGQTELMEVLLGTRETASGKIFMEGENIAKWPTRKRREEKLGFIPEDRHKMGLMLPSPLWENAMLGHQGLKPYAAKGFWLRPRSSRAKCKEIVADFDVRTPGVKVPADALSGGNQQKLIIGREMSMHPKVLIAAHPTRGIDVGAQAAVWDDLKLARQGGLAVLLISADLDELIGLSDKLLVIFRGEIVAELDPSEVTPRELGSYMTGVAQPGADSETRAETRADTGADTGADTATAAGEARQ